jgi:hypothetical protein
VACGISATASKFGQALGPMAGSAAAQLKAVSGSNLAKYGIALGLTAGAVTAGVAIASKARKEVSDPDKAAVPNAFTTAEIALGSATPVVREKVAGIAESARGAAASARQAVSDATASARQAAGDAAAAYVDKVDELGDKVGSRVAPAAGKVLKAADGPVGKVVSTAGTIGVNLVALRNPAVAGVMGLVNAAGGITRAVGNTAGEASRTDLAGTVVQDKRVALFFKGKEAVNLWKSSLTGRLNRADLLGSHRLANSGSVYASDGVMFETRGQTWHRGTSVISTPSGGQRTVTHLQSLGFPARHYYFDRRVGDEDAVGIATGRVSAAGVPGYVGQIGGMEGLLPGWKQTKRAMITSVLYWGDRTREKSA